MSTLRDTLIKAQEDVTLRELLQGNFDTTSDNEKRRMLAVVRTVIENDVDKMIREEVHNHNENAPVRKNNRKLFIFIGIINIVLTTLLSYAVNIENWAIVVGIGIALIITFLIPAILEGN